MKYRLAVLLFAVLFWPAVSHAQEYPRFEIGPMFTVTPTRDGGPMTTGFGGRLVGNFSPRIGLEFQLATYQWMTQNVHRAEADFFHVYICLIAADAAGIDAILARRNAVNSETPSEFHCGGRIGNPMPGLKTKGRSETFARTPAGSALLSSVIRPEMDTGGSNVTTTPSTSLPRTSTDAVAIGGIGGG